MACSFVENGSVDRVNCTANREPVTGTNGCKALCLLIFLLLLLRSRDPHAQTT